jgi:hypothetical protein
MSFGQVGTGLAADGNGDGIVDAADYVIWRNNVGRSRSQGIVWHRTLSDHFLSNDDLD